MGKTEGPLPLAFELLLPEAAGVARCVSPLVSLRSFHPQPTPAVALATHAGGGQRGGSTRGANRSDCVLVFGRPRLGSQSAAATSCATAAPFASVSASTQQRVAAFAVPRVSSESACGSGRGIGSAVVLSGASTRSKDEAQLANLRSRRGEHRRQQHRRQRQFDQAEQHQTGRWRYLKRLLSGALSSITSRTVVAPLERIKLELLLGKRARASVRAIAADIFAAEGLSGFWKGHMLNVLRTTPYKAINYSSYDFYKQQLGRLSTAYNVDERIGRFAAGAMAGMTALTLCFPLDVVRTRMMADMHRPGSSVGQVVRDIVAREGAGALYTGILPALISIAPSGAVFYGTYDLLKEAHVQRLRDRGMVGPDVATADVPLGVTVSLLHGAAAGAAAELSVYPLEVIRRKMQLQGGGAAVAAARHAGRGVLASHGAAAAGLAHGVARAQVSGWQNFVNTFWMIARTEGVAGFYTGLLPNVMQVLPNAAFSYYTYELLKRSLNAS